MTPFEALTNAFGESAKKIDMSRCTFWADRTDDIAGVALMIGDTSRVFVQCGGEVIAHLYSENTKDKGTTLTFYLVRDDADGEAWDYWRQQYAAKEVEFDSKKYHCPRPSPMLRLVASV